MPKPRADESVSCANCGFREDTYCYLNPPTVVPCDYAESSSEYPLVSDDCWCGHHQPIPETRA